MNDSISLIPLIRLQGATRRTSSIATVCRKQESVGYLVFRKRPCSVEITISWHLAILGFSIDDIYLAHYVQDSAGGYSGEAQVRLSFIDDLHLAEEVPLVHVDVPAGTVRVFASEALHVQVLSYLLLDNYL